MDIKILDFLDIIHRRLATFCPQKFVGFIFGAMTKLPWHTKANKNGGKIKAVTTPGRCVSFNQLEYIAPGFISQLKLYLTNQSYNAATIFVDHLIRLIFVHLQRGLTS